MTGPRRGRPTHADPAGRAYLDLRRHASQQGRPTQELLTLYVLERFLARMSVSQHAGDFILKGGMLMAALHARRPTVDIDLLAERLANDEQSVLDRLTAIAARSVEPDDGVRYLPETARARTIRDGDQYAGVRVTMQAKVSTAQVKLALDVNFGDPVTPEAGWIDYPSVLPSGSSVRLRGYPVATVLAEKLVTAVTLGAANTRARDYADLWTLTGIHDLDADQVHQAITATARYREAVLTTLTEATTGLIEAQAGRYDAYRQALGNEGDHLPASFATVVGDIRSFADPVLQPPGHETRRWLAAARRWESDGE